MSNDEEAALLKLLTDSLLPGQDGITIRAFLAFNRGNTLACRDSLEALSAKGSIIIKDETVFPVEIL